MNHDRRIYLATYFWIDVLDGRIKNAHIFYRVWNYWHYPMNHCLAIKIASAYEFCLQCCEGLICPFWKVENPATYQNLVKYFQVRFYRTTQCRNYIQEITR